MPVLSGQIVALIGFSSSGISFFTVLDKRNFATGHGFKKVVLVGQEESGWEAQVAALEAKYPLTPVCLTLLFLPSLYV